MIQAAQTRIFSMLTRSVVLTSMIISLARNRVLFISYHAPLSVYNYLEAEELPRLLNASGLLPPYTGLSVEDMPRIDLSPVKEFNLTLCLGKEWYRFPSHYLVPDGVRVDFIKSEFNGALPGHFIEKFTTSNKSYWWKREGTRHAPVGLNDLNLEVTAFYVGASTPFDSTDIYVTSRFQMRLVTTSLTLTSLWILSTHIWNPVTR